MIDHLLSLILELLLSPLYYFIVFLSINWFLLPPCFFVILWLLPLFRLSIILSSAFAHPCYCLEYPLDLFLIRYLLLYLSFLKYNKVQSCSLVTSNTIWLVIHWVCEVLWSTSSFHSLSKLQIFLLHPVNTVSIL